LEKRTLRLSKGFKKGKNPNPKRPKPKWPTLPGKFNPGPPTYRRYTPKRRVALDLIDDL